MFKNTKKGFTLIELLVVIAIIGILSSVVLASLNTARGKGADAAIKSNLAGIRAQAEIVYDNNSGVYDDICNDPTVVAAITAAKSAAGVATLTGLLDTGGTSTVAVCHLAVNENAWAISVPLKTNSQLAWCVDSTGASRQLGIPAYLGSNQVAC